MCYWPLVIIMFLFGLFAVIKGELTIVGKLKVRQTSARVLGSILIIGAVASMFGSLLTTGAPSSDSALIISGLGQLLCLGTFVLATVVGLVIVIVEYINRPSTPPSPPTAPPANQ